MTKIRTFSATNIIIIINGPIGKRRIERLFEGNKKFLMEFILREKSRRN